MDQIQFGMKTLKRIAKIVNPPAPHMVGDGFRVHNFFPNGHQLNMSPFYLMDYNAKIEFSARNHPRGVGIHPHRGFETVTLAYHGAIAHHDSAGNSGTIQAGGVQWMTAGNGILHKEYHEENFSKNGGLFQMVQLWVNLPAVHKSAKPKYQGFAQADLTKFHLPSNDGVIEIIAGEFEGKQGKISTFSPIKMYNARLNSGANVIFDFPRSFNTAFLVIEGSIDINGTDTATADQLVYFKNDGEQISLTALSNSVVLILSGEPINEPIAAYGPFLMNSPQEIQQAIADYNEGRFGFLEE